MCTLVSYKLHKQSNVENTNDAGTMTTNVPTDRLLEKVGDAISDQATTDSKKEKMGQTKRLHHFEYLIEFPKSFPIPEEYPLSLKIIDCSVSLRNNA